MQKIVITNFDEKSQKLSFIFLNKIQMSLKQPILSYECQSFKCLIPDSVWVKIKIPYLFSGLYYSRLSSYIIIKMIYKF